MVGNKAAALLGLNIVLRGDALNTFDEQSFDAIVSGLNTCSSESMCFCDVSVAKFAKDIKVSFERDKADDKLTHAVLYLGGNEVKRKSIRSRMAFMELSKGVPSEYSVETVQALIFDDLGFYLAYNDGQSWVRFGEPHDALNLFFVNDKKVILLQNAVVDRAVLEKFPLCSKKAAQNPFNP